MPERTELLPGSFCWPELATPDSARAKAFYAGLFGWSAFDLPSAGGTYTLLRIGEKDVAALRTLSPDETAQGIPSYFMSYISTASADASAQRAKELGGTVLYGPFDVEGIGRMVVVRDPSGPVFALWEARGHIGARLVGEENTLCWTEIVTRDPASAQAFYGGLFGWTWKVSDTSSVEYFEIYRDGEAIGGVLPMRGDEWGDMPGHLMPYFRVADCDAATAKAQALGGSAVVPPQDIPHVGRFALLRDDQGAHFSVIALRE
jgi:predicted enzyme related to lactoylglutathione lyase